jgi:hypothetical protein
MSPAGVRTLPAAAKTDEGVAVAIASGKSWRRSEHTAILVNDLKQNSDRQPKLSGVKLSRHYNLSLLGALISATN